MCIKSVLKKCLYYDARSEKNIKIMSPTFAQYVLETPCNIKTARPRQHVLCMFEPLPFSPHAMRVHLYAVHCRWDALTVRSALEALQLLYSLLHHSTTTRHQLPAVLLRLRCRQYWLHGKRRSTAGNIRRCATPIYSYRMFFGGRALA